MEFPIKLILLLELLLTQMTTNLDHEYSRKRGESVGERGIENILIRNGKKERIRREQSLQGVSPMRIPKIRQ